MQHVRSKITHLFSEFKIQKQSNSLAYRFLKHVLFLEMFMVLLLQNAGKQIKKISFYK